MRRRCDRQSRALVLVACTAALCWSLLTGCAPEAEVGDGGRDATSAVDAWAPADASGLDILAADTATPDTLADAPVPTDSSSLPDGAVPVDSAAGADLALGDRVTTEAAVPCALSCDCPVEHICDADGVCKHRSTVFGPYLHPICCLDPVCAGSHEPCQYPDGTHSFCDARDAGYADGSTSDSGSLDSHRDSAVADSRSDDLPGQDGAIDASAADRATPDDPCPDLPIPATCHGRSVVYREWGPEVVGDGTYFVGQEPQRLGFTRTQGTIWIVKVQLEANTYSGRLSAYGDADPGAAWISREPCNAADAFDLGLVVYGNHGGGTMFFVIARDDADAETLRSDPDYAPQYSSTPQLRGGHCYYLVFENTGEYPQVFDANYLATSADWCGAYTGLGSCYYLAMDFAHYLHSPTTGDLMQGAVIPGLTQP